MEKNWSELPEELLRIIAEKNNSIEDFARFSGVCNSWRSVTLAKHHFSLVIKPSHPWLMLTDDNNVGDNRRFLNLFEDNVYNISLPEASGFHCWGSPLGWLVTLGFDRQLHLLNPLSRARLSLPVFEDDSDYSSHLPGSFHMHYMITRAMVFKISTKTTTVWEEQLLVFIIRGASKRLAFARPGDTTWTTIQSSQIPNDILQFNGQFYIVDSEGLVFHCDITGPCPTSSTPFAHPPEDVMGTDRFYLVEMVGEMHLIARILDFEEEWRPETVDFEVFKLDSSGHKWEKIYTLRDQAIFIGNNSSFSVKVSDYPQCNPSCIYFTDDSDQAFGRLVGGDMGVFNIETKEFSCVYEGDDILSRFSAPVWVSPNPF